MLNLEMLVWEALKLLLVAFSFFYASMVLISYRLNGPHYPLQFDRRDPGRSAESLAIWLGIQLVRVVVRVSKPVVDVLLDVSAELGEWVIRRYRLESLLQDRSRSQ